MGSPAPDRWSAALVRNVLALAESPGAAASDELAALSGWPPEVLMLVARCAFAAWLRAARARACMAPYLLARRLHVTTAQLRDWETGAYTPNHAMRLRAANALEVAERRLRAA